MHLYPSSRLLYFANCIFKSKLTMKVFTIVVTFFIYLNSPFQTLKTPADTTILVDNLATSSSKVATASELRFIAAPSENSSGSLDTRLHVIFPDDVSNTIKVKYEVVGVEGLLNLLDVASD